MIDHMAGAPSRDPLPPDLQAARDEAAVRIAAFKQSMSHNARAADGTEAQHTDGSVAP